MRVLYRPVRRFHEQAGMLLNKSHVVTYIQDIEVNNTRPDSVHVVLIDQVPRSTEDKLTVSRNTMTFVGNWRFSVWKCAIVWIGGTLTVLALAYFQVTLLEPALSADRREAKGYLLNQDNNLEHEVDVKGRTKYVWTIKYKLEYPADKEIEESEVESSRW